MYDSTIFNRYINEIGDPKIQEIVEECLQKVNITRLLLLVKVD